jgi:2-amino-4-hydroxy-6-hydroxymethyldihydropteridine diphosphokinase
VPTVGEQPDRVIAYIGLGSNVGDRALALRSAASELGQTAGVNVTNRSSIYETEPVGGPPQPAFLNAVLEIDTALEADALLELCLNIERKLGRNRNGALADGPRSIDLDVLLYGDHVIARPGLVVPHPEMHRRAFVLAPLVEVLPGARHPALGRAAVELLAEIAPAQPVRRTGETW